MVRHPMLVSVIIASGLLVSCAPDASDSSAASLSPTEQQGRDLARSSGCMACHAPGGSASNFVGLAGSTVQLGDGSTVVADTAYLTESINDPAAKRVAGSSVSMPTNSLTAAETAQIVAYIEALSAP